MSDATITFVSNDLSNFTHHRKHLVDLAIELGMRAVLFAGGNASVPPANCEYRPLDIERFRLHWTDIQLILVLCRHFLHEKPSVIHLINLKPYLFGGLTARVARAFGWHGRVVVSVPGLGRLYDRSQNGFASRLRRAIVEFALRVGLREATVCFETAADRDFWVERGLVEFERTVVTNGTGIDLSSFRPQQINVPRQRLRVLYAGRLLKAKGLDVFLDAAMIGNAANVDMVVAGETDADPDAVSESLLRQHPRITFLGKVDDMPRLLAETDIVVLPSRYNEGVPRVLIEAAACACVPVATRFAGSRALIKDGETGYFILEGTRDAQAAEIASLIQRLANDRVSLRAVGKNASNYVRNNGFSVSAIKDTFRPLYSGNGAT
ncbi:glycosyltransferase [Rhodopseudomonas parapalustris]